MTTNLDSLSDHPIEDAVEKCDNITPIYPVRYAYVNLFDELVAASEPPDVNTLLNATSVQASKGYAIRLLREGWVYIREEGGKDVFHIFKYTQVKTTNGVNERFEKYLFANGINAQGGLRLDTSSGRASYPFVFVSPGTSNISIAYSQHEWAPNIIDRMNGNKSERTAAMQQVNIVSDSSGHTVDATKENLSLLVEDYRGQQRRILSQTAGIGVDLLTTQESYQLSPDAIAAQIQNSLCYQEKAKIVALFDPVGRQIELAQAHAKLALWEQDYSSMNLYPYMIGGFVDSFLKHPDKDVKSAASDNIDTAAHAEYWGKMQTQFDTFKARREKLLNIYSTFAYGSSATKKVGSLDTYMKMFFDPAPGSNEATELELQKLAEISSAYFSGLMASQEGKSALEDMITHAHEKELDLKEKTNAYDVTVSLLQALVTQPQAEFDWADRTARSMDIMLGALGPMWGEIMAWGQYSSKLAYRAGNKLSANALQYTVDRVIPKVWKVMGITIENGKVRYTTDKLAQILSEAIDKQIELGGNKGLESLKRAQRSLERGQRLFDWANLQRSSRLPKLWSLAKVNVTRASGGRFAFSVGETTTQRIGIAFDTSFAGLSVFANVMTVTSILNQSRFDHADPLKPGGASYDALRLTSCISALTVDVMVIARGGLLVGEQVIRTMPASMATRFVPGLSSGAQHFGRLLAGKAATRLIAIANFIGAITSGYDAYNAARAGNHGAAVGHAAISLGSALLFVGATKALFAGAGAASGTGVGLPVGVAIFALGLIVGGVGLLLYYEKSPFENLLFNCFWGKSNRYGFWAFEKDGYVDISRRLQLANYLNERNDISVAYQLELQEFMNFLAMPSLSLDRFGGSLTRQIVGNSWYNTRHYTYSFVLPQFRAGVSEVIGGIYKADGYDLTTGQIKTVLDGEATKKFKAALQQAMSSPERAIYKEGALYLEVSAEFTQRANLLWIYQPMPGVFTPLRVISGNGNLIRSDQLIAGMVNEKPRG